jgi:hypothetical protein
LSLGLSLTLFLSFNSLSRHRPLLFSRIRAMIILSRMMSPLLVLVYLL